MNEEYSRYQDEAQVYLAQFQELPIVQSILRRLESELSDDLFYHNYEHTLDVLEQAVFLGVVDQLAPRQLELLAIAAAYHDAGFLKRRVENEPIGALMAKEAMESTGNYTQEELQLVITMILDTRIVETSMGPRQVPTTELSKYLLDADLSNLGRDDFFEKEELFRRELRFGEDVAHQKALELLNSHRFLSNAAREIRATKKQENRTALLSRLEDFRARDTHLRYLGVSLDNLGFLTQLASRLNSAHDTQKVIQVVLSELSDRVNAQAATVFLVEDGAEELSFWALSGGRGSALEGKRMPKGKGIVGWVIGNAESVLVSNVSEDERFFSEIDKKGDFKTTSVICSPLKARGDVVLGAIQVLNSKSDHGFLEEDRAFVEHVAQQLSIAIDNVRMYERLVESNRKLAVLNQRKDDMITLIVHEIRTPLNVIQTSSELLADSGLQPQMLEKMSGTLRNGVRRLSQLTEQVRGVAMVARQDMRLQRERVCVESLIRDVIQQFEQALETRQLSATNNCVNDLWVNADASLLVVVLSNLLSNAIRFTADGGAIDISVQAEHGLGVFRVKDTGIGIAQEQVPLIFEKFYEVGDVLQHSSGEYAFKSGGLGIGLATVKAILEAHGSSIQVESEEGSGSCFSFSLPQLS